MVSLFKGYNADYRGLIPPYIVLTEPQGRFSEAGFLGARYNPSPPGAIPPKRPSPWKAWSAKAFPSSARRAGASCCTSWTRWPRPCRATPNLAASAQCEKQAYDLILGDAGKVFDLAQEKNELRDRYGRNTFGQSCLVARRLVERGVPYVTINYNGGWDTHKDNFQTMRRRVPEMDKGMADAVAGFVRSRAAGQDHRVVGRRVRPDSQGHVGSPVERRTRPSWRKSSPPWSPAAVSKAATWSAPPTPKGNKSRTGPSIRATSSAACMSCSALIPTPNCRIPQGLDVRVDALRRGRQSSRRADCLKEIM